MFYTYTEQQVKLQSCVQEIGREDCDCIITQKFPLEPECVK